MIAEPVGDKDKELKEEFSRNFKNLARILVGKVKHIKKINEELSGEEKSGVPRKLAVQTDSSTQDSFFIEESAKPSPN